MAVDDDQIEAVAEYLRQYRFKKDRPVRRMARDALELAEEVRLGTRRKLTEAEIEQRDADRRMQRHRNRVARREQQGK